MPRPLCRRMTSPIEEEKREEEGRNKSSGNGIRRLSSPAIITNRKEGWLSPEEDIKRREAPILEMERGTPPVQSGTNSRSTGGFLEF